MTIRTFWTVNILALLLMNIPQSRAEVGEKAQQDFQAGIEAFQSGELKAALRHFQAAQAAGLDSRSLHYNLGVLYYRLQEYTAARQHFLHLIQFPETAALAHYNLGLVALKQQDTDAARDHFSQAQTLSQEAKLRSLAQRQLKALAVPVEPKAPKRWYGLASLAAGYDDNVTLLPDEITSSEEDGFAEALAALSGYGLGDRNRGWRLEGNVYSRHYLDVTDFNQSAWLVGTFYDQAWDSWWSGIGIAGEWFYAGGDPVEHRTRLPLELRYPLVQGTEGQWRARLSYAHIDSYQGYQAYEGEQQRAGLEYRGQDGLWNWRVGYEFERNDRKDLTTETEFFSLSPTHHRLHAELIRQVGERWQLGPRLDLRYSAYADPHVLETENGSQSETRREYRGIVSLIAFYDLSAFWRIKAELEYQKNESTLELYDYERREILLGIERVF